MHRKKSRKLNGSILVFPNLRHPISNYRRMVANEVLRTA